MDDAGQRHADSNTSQRQRRRTDCNEPVLADNSDGTKTSAQASPKPTGPTRPVCDADLAARCSNLHNGGGTTTKRQADNCRDTVYTEVRPPRAGVGNFKLSRTSGHGRLKMKLCWSPSTVRTLGLSHRLWSTSTCSTEPSHTSNQSPFRHVPLNQAIAVTSLHSDMSH